MEAFRPTQNDSTRLIHEACVFFGLQAASQAALTCAAFQACERDGAACAYEQACKRERRASGAVSRRGRRAAADVARMLAAARRAFLLIAASAFVSAGGLVELFGDGVVDELALVRRLFGIVVGGDPAPAELSVTFHPSTASARRRARFRLCART